MKKWLLGLCLLLGLLSIPEQAQAASLNYPYTPEGADYTYTYYDNGDGTATISGFTGAAQDLVIVDEINGLTVTNILTRAFDNSDDLSGSLTIPDSVKTIGQYAFSGCENLTGDLVIGDGVETIGQYAFKNCKFTGTLTLGDSLQALGPYCFYQIPFTGGLVLPDSLVTIDNSAFKSCTGLTGSLTIPNSAETIAMGAFEGCTGLNGTLTLGARIVEIGSSAFKGCTGFTGSLVIPDSVTALGINAFYGCTGFSGGLTLGSGVQSIGEKAFYNCSGLTGSLRLPEGLTTIGKYAFANCSGLTGDLVLPTTLTTLGVGIVSGCSGLTGSLTVQGDQLAVPSSAFSSTSFTRDLTIGSGVASIGSSAFSSSDFIGTLTIENGVTAIGSSAFSGLGFTGSLTIPDSVEVIGEEAFQKCTGFTGDLVIGGNGAEIGKRAFYNCKNFEGTLTLGSVVSIGQEAFYTCGFTGDLTIPDTVTTLESSCFYNNTFTGSLVVGSGVTAIPGSAFYSCDFTGTLTLPTGLLSISDRAFQNCPFTGTLTLPEGLTAVNSYAFAGTPFAGDLAIPASVTHLGQYAFYQCSAFDGTLTLSPNIPAISTATFSGCSGLTGDLIIPDSVTELGDYAFQKCSGFTGDLIIGDGITAINKYQFSGATGFQGRLVIGGGVTTIGDSSFEDYTFSGSLALPGGLTSIGASAFADCAGFTGSLTVPESVTSIGNAAFYKCSGFNGPLTLSPNLTTLGTSVFYNCSGLTGDLTIPSSITAIPASIFRGCSGLNGVLSLPAGLTSIGSNAFSGTALTGSLSIPRTVTEIGSSAFSGCSNLLGTLSIPDSVTSLGTSAFSSCSGLTGLTLGRGVTAIPNSAFYHCSGLLGTLVIPEGVVSIGSSAFAGASSATAITIPGSVTSIADSAFSSAGITDIYYAGSEAEWALVSGYDQIGEITVHFSSGTTETPEGDADAIGTVETNTASSITIDGLTYTLADDFTLTENQYQGKFVKFTLNEAGQVTSVTALIASTAVLDNWESVIGFDYAANVTLGGIQYTYSKLGTRDFCLYLELIQGQQVRFYRDASYMVYHLEAVPDTAFTYVGRVTSSTADTLTLNGIRLTLDGPTLTENQYQGKYIKATIRGCDTITAIEPLNSVLGTLTGWSANTRRLTISAQVRTLSELSDADPSRLLNTVVRYHFDETGTVYHLEQGKPDPSQFVESIYRADYLVDTSNTPTQVQRDLLERDTPCEILLDSMVESGFVTGALTWDGVTFAVDSTINISNATNVVPEAKDLYAAIILDILEISSQSTEYISTFQDLTAPYQEMLNSINDWGQAMFSLDLTSVTDYASLTQEQLQTVSSRMNDAFYAFSPELNYADYAGEILRYTNYFLTIAQDIEDAMNMTLAYLQLYQMSDAMKTVVRTMLAEAVEGGYPLPLQLALADCVEIVNAASYELFLQETFLDVEYTFGNSAVQILLSEFWATTRRAVELSHPGIAILHAVYSVDKLACNVLWNTDNLADQYWEVSAVLKVEDLLTDTCDTLRTAYIHSGTVDDAEAFIAAFSTQFAARDRDCATAANYVDTVDSVLVGQLREQIKELINHECAGAAQATSDSLRESISIYRSAYATQADLVNTAWINALEEDFPGQGLTEYYEQQLSAAGQTIQKTVEVACPVEVYVYDAGKTLVGCVTEDALFASGALTVRRSGETKYLYFTDDGNYSITCVGTDAGDMDMVMTTADREVFFYDVALADQLTYTTTLTAPVLAGESTAVSPDLDTQDTVAASHTVSIQGGSIAAGDELLSSAKALAGERLSITALVPAGYTFQGWTADADVVFADAGAASTTVRMPESDVTITALLTEATIGVTSLTLSDTLLVLQTGETHRLTADSTVTWTSLDEDVATVTADGTVTAAAPGTAVILAVSTDGGCRAACTVTVRGYDRPIWTVEDRTVTVSLENGALAGNDLWILAAYDEQDRLQSTVFCDSFTLTENESTVRLTFTVDGAPASMKLFTLSARNNLRPLTEAAAWTN